MKQIQWFPGHMSKAKREVGEKLKLVDIVFELVDARIPFSSSNPMFNEVLNTKPRVLVMTKKDLADDKIVNQWKEYYKEKYQQILVVNLNQNFNYKLLTNAANDLLKEKFEKEAKKGLKKRSIRAMIIGIPNVGKSTLINKMSKRKATKTGDRPGVTKAQQWIKVDNDFELLDTPGILWPKFEKAEIGYSLAITGAIKDQILPLEDVAIYTLKFLEKHYKDRLIKRFELEGIDLNDLEAVFDHIGKKRGCLVNNKEVNYDRVNNLIIQDVRNLHLGKICFDMVDELV